MKYRVEVGPHKFEIVIDGDSVVVDGLEVTAELHDKRGIGVKELVLGNRSLVLAFEPADDGWIVQREGVVVDVVVQDERDRLLRRFDTSTSSASKGGQVKAPMPGLVLRLNVEEGEAVTKGQGLLVLEAMKMENEIKSPVAGKVSSVGVTTGQAVDKGTLLIEVVAEG